MALEDHVNYRRLALVFAMLLPVSPAVHAASVVMVQFGSFETMDEAQKRLAEVKSTHGADIGKLATAVREVKLPPNNLTVYRTQAGPVESRAAAQEICTKLAGSGDECYVVEMAANPSSTPVPVAETAPAYMAAPTPVVVATPVAAATPADTGGAARDAQSAAALASVTPSPASTLPPPPVIVEGSHGLPGGPALAPLSPATPSPALQDALEKAINEQEVAKHTTRAVPPPTAPKATSFWDRLNPFSDDTPAAAPARTASKHPLLAPPVLPADTAATPMAAAAPGLLPPPSVLPEAPKLLADTSLTTPPPLPPPPPITFVPAPAADAHPLLLPPPIPTVSNDNQKLLEASRAVPYMLPPPMSPMPASASSMPPAMLSVQDMSIKETPLPPPSAAAKGNVSVEEAKRVPLSETTPPPTPAPVVIVPPLAAETSAAPTISLRPSATLGQKTTWAQLGQFKTTDDALIFWDKYRKSHPDFPPVRVRVAASMQQQAHGNSEVWLRVGPFARPEVIANLCESISSWSDAPSNDIGCGHISDTGVAADALKTRFLQGSRYSR